MARRSAKATEAQAKWAFRTFWVGVAGTIAVAVTLIFTAKAADAAKLGAEAAKRAAEVAESALVTAERAYVHLHEIEYESCLNTKTEETWWSFHVKWKKLREHPD